MPMDYEKTKKRILNFVNKNRGKTVLFHNLTSYGKYSYMLTEQYLYHRNYVSNKEALKRAVENADWHRKEGYEAYQNPMESMTIAKR